MKKNNEIVKIDDVLYITVIYRPGKGLGVIPLFKKVNYYNDYLVVQILDFTAPIICGPI